LWVLVKGEASGVFLLENSLIGGECGMNVFVTGASGFVGKALIEAMSGEPAVDNIFALYRKKEQIPILPKVVPVMGDLKMLPDMKLDAQIDVLIHLAGYFKTESESYCEEINVQGTRNTIFLCQNNNIRKILFFSTINVDLKSKGCYAKSKLAAEDEIKGSGLDYMILRPSLVYKDRTGSIGKIITYVEKLPFVPIFGNGKAKEQPIHIDELIELTIAMVKNFKPGLTLYAAGKDSMSFQELVQTIGKSMNRKTRLLRVPAKPVRWLLKIFEKAGIHPGISSEQVAHMSEDLTADMSETLKLYPVKLKSFEDHLQFLRNN
jgi:NADH dehydrogenase